MRSLERDLRPNEAILERRLNHDSQAGGATTDLWHVALEVDTTGWSLPRVLLWRSVIDSIELS